MVMAVPLQSRPAVTMRHVENGSGQPNCLKLLVRVRLRIDQTIARQWFFLIR